MNVRIDDNLKQRLEIKELLQQANRLLEEAIGPSHKHVNVDWKGAKDQRGRFVIALQLSDPWSDGPVSAEFSPDELHPSSEMRYRFIRLWGDVLQNRSHRLVEAMTSGSHAIGD